MAELLVTQLRSTIGTKKNQRDTLRTLGLHKIRQSVVREDSPQVRGMLATVAHLVAVEPVAAGAAASAKSGSGGKDTQQ